MLRQALAQVARLGHGCDTPEGKPAQMTYAIVVTGAPGAGKTALAANLAMASGAAVMLPDGTAESSRSIDALKYARLGAELATLATAPETCIVETCAYGAPWRGSARVLIVVLDGVRFAAGKTPLATADEQAIGCADLIAVTRGDLVDVGPVCRDLTQRFSTPALDVRHGKLAPGELPQARPRMLDLPPYPATRCWSYAGGARLTDALAEKLLKQRPTGTQRVKGIAVSPSAGLELEQSGRARSISPCPAPAETMLFAAGPAATFSEQAMNLHFAEIASDGAATAGWFGFR